MARSRRTGAISVAAVWTPVTVAAQVAAFGNVPPNANKPAMICRRFGGVGDAGISSGAGGMSQGPPVFSVARVTDPGEWVQTKLLPCRIDPCRC
jgi:hypothetical protein